MKNFLSFEFSKFIVGINSRGLFESQCPKHAPICSNMLHSIYNIHIYNIHIYIIYIYILYTYNIVT